MSRPSRESDPGSILANSRTFFVTSKSAQGRSILQSERMASLFIEVLRSYVKAKRFVVHEFTVMPNHVHLLITVKSDISIEKAVQLIKGNFSYRARKEFALEHEIWQRGFSEDRVLDRESYLQRKRYIDLNAVRAGLAKEPEEYPYCSAYFRKLKASKS